MPDDLPSRLARVEQRVIDHESRINAMFPIITTVATLNERVQQVRDDFAEFRRKIDARDAANEEREEANSRERRSLRLALLAMTVTILCALLAAAVTIGTAAFH